MHEFELGIWKALFAHLIRILQAVDPNLEHILNERQVNLPFQITHAPLLNLIQVSCSADLWSSNHTPIYDKRV